MRQTVQRQQKRLVLIGVLGALSLGGCASTSALSGDEEAREVLTRLSERRDSIQSAIYRVRWRAVGTEPHAEFILEIAYKAPEQFRIVATGPFGLPAFTAVVLGDDFTFVNHRDGKFITDEIANLIDYEFPVAEFFEGPWRDLFAGGWGGSHEVQTLTREDVSNRFRARTEDTEWSIQWNRGKRAPSGLSATVDGGEGTLEADVWFDNFSPKHPPYWQIDRLVLKGMAGKGEHRWKLTRQEYNIEVPDRFFVPLRAPEQWELPRK